MITVVWRIVISENNVPLNTGFVFYEQICQNGGMRNELNS